MEAEGLLVILLVVGVVAVFLYYSLKRLIVVADPNEALVISGAQHQVGRRKLNYRIIPGGRHYLIPLFQRVDRIDLRNISIDIEVHGAYSKGGIPLTVKAVANVKIPSQEPMIHNAVERFLGRNRSEITFIAKETLEGNLRGVLAKLTPEEVNEDKNQFARVLTEAPV